MAGNMKENTLNPNSLDSKIEELLKSIPELITEEKELRYNKIKEMAENGDEVLLVPFLSNPEIKNAFFTPILDSFVFKTKEFKEFLEYSSSNNSYSKHLGKRIGLYCGDSALTDRSEVVLNFPFKDCVLEGGQKKEDGLDTYFEYDETESEYVEKQSKRREVFFNEILAKDEIDNLFSPKSFCNVKRYEKNSDNVVESVETTKFTRDAEINKTRGLSEDTITDNLIIKGNNLLALHSLKREFEGKIKLIYIDPPYNTGNDSFSYNDNFNHSSWLTFMKNRLEVAKDLLRDDGCIFVQCDDNEQAYLKVLMDEIFGRENFVSIIAYQRSGVAGLGQGGDFVVNVTEYISIFSKKKEKFSAHNLDSFVPLELKHMKRYNSIFKQEGSKELFRSFISKSTGTEVKIFKHKNYEIEKISLDKFDKREDEIRNIYAENFNKIFRLNVPQDENAFQWSIIDSFEDENLYSVEYLVSRGKNKGQVVTNYYWKNQLFAWLNPSRDEKAIVQKMNKMSDFWTHGEIPKADLANEGNVQLKRGKKPEQLLKRIIDIISNPSDIILDYHLGSGTTAAVAHKMNRQYIGVEQLNYGENDSVVRLQNVIKGDSTGISKSVDWQGGGSFVYMELAEKNEKAMQLISACKNYDELVSIFNTLSTKYFLHYNVRINDFINKTCKEEQFKNLSLEKQKEIFCRMLDLNQLYVNCDDRNDKDSGLSENDIKATEKFYQIQKDGE